MFCQGRWLRSIREYRSLPWLMFKHGWCFSAVYVSMHAMFQHSKIKTLSKNSVLLEIRVLSAWLQGVQNKWNILLHAFFFLFMDKIEQMIGQNSSSGWVLSGWSTNIDFRVSAVYEMHNCTSINPEMQFWYFIELELLWRNKILAINKKKSLLIEAYFRYESLEIRYHP